MLVHAKRIIAEARRRRRTAVAFNTFNAETTLAVARAAQRARSAVLLEISEKTIEYLGLDMVVKVCSEACRGVRVPMALHLDHGHTYEVCKRAADAGFSSVMFDGSGLPYRENVRITKRVVRYAHRRGVFVQGEVGSLEAAKGRRLRVAKDLMTDPKQAADFVKRTGVDTLGVSVGTLHGPMKMIQKLPHIDFERLKAIHRATPVPLVLHGASGVPAAHVKRAAKLGVAIMNIDTELRAAFLGGLKSSVVRNSKHFDPRVVLAPAVSAVEESAFRKLKSISR